MHKISAQQTFAQGETYGIESSMQFSISYLRSVVHLDGSGYRHVVWFTNSKREQGTASNFGQSKDRFQVYSCRVKPQGGCILKIRGLRTRQ
jgi:hypothetical protein